MSGVVLRCSTCGTTQSHPGECEACLEGKVRYFCGNHSPGFWIDEPVCHVCGARFGETPRARPAPTPRVAPPLPARETRRPDSRPPVPRRVEPLRPDLTRAPRAADPEDTPASPSLMDLLAHIATKRARAPRREPTAEAPRARSVSVMGCLLWLVILVLGLIALAVGGLYLLVTGVR